MEIPMTAETNVDEILRLRGEGWGITKIARHLRMRTGNVIAALNEAGKFGQPYFLTDEEKKKALELRLQGYSAEVIADSLGRSKAAIVVLLQNAKLNTRRIRPIEVIDGVAYIHLTRGIKAKVDVADLPLVTGKSWFASGITTHPYAAARVEAGKKPISLHRFLMGCPEGLHIDHINGDTLDNRRCNLRVATPRENTANARRRPNKSGYIGVTQTTSGKFYAAVQIGLGTFDSPEDAARAYDAKATELFGAFAMTNVKRGLLPEATADTVVPTWNASQEI
jgi:transcriptional regulator